MRTPLTPDELAAALASLPSWSGDGRRLRRSARLTPALRAGIARVADELDHHPVLEEGPDGTRLVLWTHVRDAVTEQDVALAHALDALLDG